MRITVLITSTFYFDIHRLEREKHTEPDTNRESVNHSFTAAKNWMQINEKLSHANIFNSFLWEMNLMFLELIPGDFETCVLDFIKKMECSL